MAQIETLRYRDQVVGLVMLDERWWVSAEIAGRHLDARSSHSTTFDAASEGERLKAFLENEPPVDVLSAR